MLDFEVQSQPPPIKMDKIDKMDKLKAILNNIDAPIGIMDIMDSEPEQVEQSKFEQVTINKGRRKKRSKRKRVNINSSSNNYITAPQLFYNNKESKELKETKGLKEVKEVKELKEEKELKEVNELNEVKELKEVISFKDRMKIYSEVSSGIGVSARQRLQKIKL